MHLLLLAAADTMLVRQVPPDRTGFEQAVFVAAGLAQIVTLVVVVLLAIIFFRMWKAQQAMQEQLSRLSSQVDPMIKSATAAAENVRALTDAVRRDAGEAAAALSDATSRVRDAVSGIADRIDAVGELLGRVTAKADAVVDVASAAASTIQAGRRLWDSRRDQHAHRGEEPRHLRDAPPRAHAHAHARPAPAERPSDDVEAPEEELEEPLRLTDDEDAHESPYADDAAPSPRGGRRRRRRRRRGGGGAGTGGNGGSPPPV